MDVFENDFPPPRHFTVVIAYLMIFCLHYGLPAKSDVHQNARTAITSDEFEKAVSKSTEILERHDREGGS